MISGDSSITVSSTLQRAGHQASDSQIMGFIPGRALLHCNSRQVVYMLEPLSNKQQYNFWYWPKGGGDAQWLKR